MSGTFTLLVKQNIKAAMQAKAFWAIVAIALIPPALTAAWVGTHQNDLALTAIEWDPQSPTSGENVTITALVSNKFERAAEPFNVTIRVGFYQQNQDGSATFVARHNDTQRVDGLGPGRSTEVTTTWQSQAGNFLVEAWADMEDVIAEIEELNNPRQAQLQVQYEPVRPDIQAPASTPTDNNTTLAVADIGIDSIEWTPEQLFAEKNATFQVTLTNHGPNDVEDARLTFQIFRISASGIATGVEADETSTFSLEAGVSTTLTFQQNDLAIGNYAVAGFLDTGAVANDTNDDNDVLIRQFGVDRQLIFEEPPEKATAKSFYRNVLELLHFRLLIPLVALFYAAGVIEDERSQGNLPYLLTRPVPRWMMPIARFSTSFVVGGIALAVGIVATFLLLLGQPNSDPGFLYWPLVFSLLVLFVYTAAATFLGVFTSRPYLFGLLYVLGVEAFILLGRNILVNGQPLLQDWVTTLSLTRWVRDAFAAWDPSLPVVWIPTEGDAVRGFLVLIGIGLVTLIGSSVWMRRREFQLN